MATYVLYGKGTSLYDAQRIPTIGNHDFATNLLYVTPTNFGYLNPDGSISYFTGTGFVWDPVNQIFSSGTITSIKHFMNGLPIDEITGLNVQAEWFWGTSSGSLGTGVSKQFSDFNLFAGDDIIDARVRANNEVIDTILRGYGGNDTIYGGRGNDTLKGDEGNDILYGGAGNDKLDGGTGANKLYGGDGDDVLLGGIDLGNDFLSGDAGNDKLDGGMGADTLYGGIGDDILMGGIGRSNDFLSGDAGNDKLFTSDGNDTLNGGTGNDVLISGLGADKLNGGDGNDILSGGSTNIVYAGSGVAPSSAENDAIVGGVGLDTVTYHTLFENLKIVKTTTGFTVTDYNATDTLTGVERISADNGTFEWNATTGTWNRINWVSSTSLLNGTAQIYGTNASSETLALNSSLGQTANAFGGDDIVSGGGGSDVIFGGSGNDSLYAGGGTSSDRLYGEAGNDILYGGFGTDILNGGSGQDRLSGSLGNDILTGGADGDTFYFQYVEYFQNGGQINESIVRGWGNDIVTDFQVGVDKLILDWGGRAVTNTLTLTSEGWLLTSTDLVTTNTVLLKGLTTASLTLDALLQTSPSVFNGTAGADVITENYGPTTSSLRVYNLLDGNDSLTFSSGVYPSVTVYAGNGDDRVEAINTSQGNIRTYADGVFTFDGGAGNDTLIGGRYNDTLLGGDGNDVISGGEGNDVMWGGAGADTFQFSSTRTGQMSVNVFYAPPGNDVIKDFQIGLDKLSVGLNATIVDTAAGILVTSSFLTSTGGFEPSYGTATVLLEGLHGTYTAADLFV